MSKLPYDVLKAILDIAKWIIDQIKNKKQEKEKTT